MKIFTIILFCGFSSFCYSKDLNDYKDLALNGSGEAQVHLGLFFSFGHKKDVLEAYYWMKMGAKKNIPIACRYIGHAHLYGRGTSINIELAKNWYLISAKKRDVLSMTGIAKCFEIENNWIESAAWFKLAHEHGEKGSLISLNKVFKNISTAQYLLFEERVIHLKSSISHDNFSPTKLHSTKKSSVQRIRLKNGNLYWGEVREGIAHGFGRSTSPDGTSYHGEFSNGIESGYGRTFSSNGHIKYQGLWKNGTPQQIGNPIIKNQTNY